MALSCLPWRVFESFPPHHRGRRFTMWEKTNNHCANWATRYGTQQLHVPKRVVLHEPSMLYKTSVYMYLAQLTGGFISRNTFLVFLRQLLHPSCRQRDQPTIDVWKTGGQSISCVIDYTGPRLQQFECRLEQRPGDFSGLPWQQRRRDDSACTGSQCKEEKQRRGCEPTAIHVVTSKETGALLPVNELVIIADYFIATSTSRQIKIISRD